MKIDENRVPTLVPTGRKRTSSAHDVKPRDELKNLTLEQWFDQWPEVSKQAFADQCNISISALYHYKDGIRTPNLLIALKIQEITEGRVSLHRMLKPVDLGRYRHFRNKRAGTDLL